MRPTRKAKSQIPELPRPISGQSQRQIEKNRKNQSEVQQGLVSKLNGAFDGMDYQQNPDSSYLSRGSYNNFVDDSFDMKSSTYSQKKQQPKDLPPLDGMSVLARAKNLLAKKETEIPQIKKKMKQNLKRVQQNDSDAFLTGIGVYKEKEESPPISVKKLDEDEDDEEDDEDNEQMKIDEEEMIKDLIREENQNKDDYADMWRLINLTKGEMCDYAEELYDLNKLTIETNQELGEMGVKPQRFWDLDSGLENHLPNGDKSKLFKDKHALPSLQSSRKQLPKLGQPQHRKSMTTASSKSSIKMDRQSISKQYTGLQNKEPKDTSSLISSRTKGSSYVDMRDKFY